MIRSNKRIIIIGTLPPPIGGVSIYNQRLYDYLQAEAGIEVDFIDYKRTGIFSVLTAVAGHRIVYLNCSSSWFKLVIGGFARMLNKKFLVTFHGNIERHAGNTTLADKLVLKITTLTIVLNKQSLRYAEQYARNVFQGTSFIPPVHDEVLSPDLKDLLQNCRKNYKVICSSNAHNVSFDSSGNEIYQVRFLLGVFDGLPDCCIILSDPSGQYSDYLKKNKVDIPRNVFVIKQTHSYFELLKEIDVMLRITTTDGDSISVREALYLGKIVVASGVVDRPGGVVSVNISKEEIREKLREVTDGKITATTHRGENAGEQILRIFRSMP